MSAETREPPLHVMFRVAGRRFGIPIGETREVVLPPRSFVRVPRAPAHVRGVMNFRGRVITVVVFARLVCVDGETSDPGAARVLLLEGAVRDMGLLVPEVTGIGPVEGIEPPPPGSRPEVVGVARSAGEAVTLLSVDGLVTALGITSPRSS